MKPERISELDGQPLAPWRQHLLDAAAYMEEHGHCKEGARDDSGAVCVAGALWASARNFNLTLERELHAVAQHLRLDCDRVVANCSVFDWNDRPETTKQMAVDALIGAALAR